MKNDDRFFIDILETEQDRVWKLSKIHNLPMRQVCTHQVIQLGRQTRCLVCDSIIPYQKPEKESVD